VYRALGDFTSSKIPTRTHAGGGRWCISVDLPVDLTLGDRLTGPRFFTTLEAPSISGVEEGGC
jgi:hypothetical protein